MKDEQPMCNVCGKVVSEVTVYRVWLRSLVRSDECMICYAFMNERTGPPKVEPISAGKHVTKLALEK